MLTTDTAQFLLNLLDQTSLSAGDPAFEEAAMLVVRARRELTAIIDAPVNRPSPTDDTE